MYFKALCIKSVYDIFELIIDNNLEINYFQITEKRIEIRI